MARLIESLGFVHIPPSGSMPFKTMQSLLIDVETVSFYSFFTLFRVELKIFKMSGCSQKNSKRLFHSVSFDVWIFVIDKEKEEEIEIKGWSKCY